MKKKDLQRRRREHFEGTTVRKFLTTDVITKVFPTVVALFDSRSSERNIYIIACITWDGSPDEAYLFFSHRLMWKMNLLKKQVDFIYLIRCSHFVYDKNRQINMLHSALYVNMRFYVIIFLMICYPFRLSMFDVYCDELSMFSLVGNSSSDFSYKIRSIFFLTNWRFVC